MKNPYLSFALFLAIGSLSFSAVAQSPVHKQTTSNIILNNVDNIAVTLPNVSTSGNLIVVEVTWDKQNRTLASLTDSKGNTYRQIAAETNWGTTYRSTLYYAYNISAGSTPITITANLDHKTQNLLEIYASEYSNIMSIADPLDKAKTTTGSGAAINSGAVTPTTANQLVYGIAIGESVKINAASGFNVRSTDQDNVVEDIAGASTSSQSAGFTGGGNWIAQVATFKPTLISLPIDLSIFDVKAVQDNKVELNWATASESNNDYFEIERSNDGQEWSAAGRVNGSGTTNTTVNYSFVDEHPNAGVNYYRLKQVDLDGKASMSKTITVRIDEAAVTTIKAYPNPATSYLVVEGASQAITLYSTSGQRMLVRVVPDGETKTTIDLAGLPKGAYFVKAGEKSMLIYKQ